MYKVFIDHRPIIFIDTSEFNGGGLSVAFSSVKKLRKAIKEHKDQMSIENPLYVLCTDVENQFAESFEDYAKVSAAGGLVQRENDFLIIKRNGMWDIPKGKIEKKEKKKLAAVREVEEECGITGPEVVVKLVDTYHICKYKKRKAIKKTYWYLMTYQGSKETTPQTEEGITKAIWVDENGLFRIRANTYGSINEVLDAYIAYRDA